MRPIRHTLRRLLPVFTVLAIAGVAGSIVTTRTARAWLENELNTRARLAAHAGGQSILRAVRDGDRGALIPLLDDIVRDDRVVAVAVCDTGDIRIASTPLFPTRRGLCRAAASTTDDSRRLLPHRNPVIDSLARGEPPIHVAVVPITDAEGDQAKLVVLQDLVQVRDREALVRRTVFAVLGLLVIAAWALSAVSARLTSITWVGTLTRALRGEWIGGRADADEDPPEIEGVRALAQRTAAAALEGDHEGRWTRERLRHALNDHMREESLVILANREPYIHERLPTGEIEVQHPASGLVTALEPVIRACSGTWIAHGSGSADRVTADRGARLLVPPGEESYTLRRIWMTEEEEQGYYYGFANEGLWPICHLAYARPLFRTGDWQMYQRINRRFADAVLDEVTISDPIVLVQDYHFALAPRMIRERLPDATIITFWHIPWPDSERFAVCPWREEIIHGLLGSSVIGFHTAAHCNHFMDAADTFIEARIDRVTNAVIRGGATTLIRPYPISVEWPPRRAEEVPDAAACRREVFAELDLPADTILAVGVDRLDYTKGIEERVEAVERLLERRPDLRGRFVFAQLAAPSRSRIPRYQELQLAVESSVQRINERFGTGDYLPVRMLRAHHEPDRVIRFYRAADICYVSSLHDGMNLVSKEFVAARDDEQGVLVLSRFAGAAAELADALIVNPYDLEEVSEALERAAQMPRAEQAERMRVLRAMVAENNVYRWAGRMLLDAAQLRSRARRTFQQSEARSGVRA